MNYKKGIPLYIQLKEKLLHEIKTDYKPGDRIDSESIIEKRFGVSRITVRKAIDELQRENVLEKKQGRGTFIKEPRILYDANVIGSLTQRLDKQNIPLKTTFLKYHIIEGEHQVKKLLECKKLLCIERVRTIGKKTFAYMLNYVNYDLVPNLQKEFQIESLYTFYKERYKIEFFNAEETIEAKPSDQNVAKLLGIKENEPLLWLKRLSCDANDKPIEFSDILIKHDMYQHKIMLKNERLSHA